MISITPKKPSSECKHTLEKISLPTISALFCLILMSVVICMDTTIDLSNHFLIAMPSDENDLFFSNSVVFLCEHNEDGALGVVINKPMPVGLDVIFYADGKEVPEQYKNHAILVGGPVQPNHGFIVHTPVGNWQNSLVVSDDIAMTTSHDILENLTSEHSEVKYLQLTIGYAQWSKGQLEKELAENKWLTTPASQDILFEIQPEKRYHAALAKLGIKPENLINKGAYA